MGDKGMILVNLFKGRDGFLPFSTLLHLLRRFPLHRRRSLPRLALGRGFVTLRPGCSLDSRDASRSSITSLSVASDGGDLFPFLRKVRKDSSMKACETYCLALLTMASYFRIFTIFYKSYHRLGVYNFSPNLLQDLGTGSFLLIPF